MQKTKENIMSKIQLTNLNNVSHLTELNHENLDLVIGGGFFSFAKNLIKRGAINLVDKITT